MREYNCWTCDNTTVRPEKDNWGVITIDPRTADIFGLDEQMYECPVCESEGQEAWDCD